MVDTRGSRYARLRPLSVAAPRLTDRSWEPRRAINRATTLPEQHRLCVETGRSDNVRRVAGTWQGPFQGRVFNASDVYKWLEAASWTLADDDDPVLLVKMVANLSAFLPGKVVFGIGAGWKQDEYRAYGWSFPSAGTRLRQMADTIEIARCLWTEDNVTYEGSEYQIHDASLNPKPDPLPGS